MGAAFLCTNVFALTASNDDVTGTLDINFTIKAKTVPTYSCIVKEAPSFSFGEVNPKEEIFLDAKLNIECDTDGVLVKFKFDEKQDEVTMNYIDSDKYTIGLGVTVDSLAAVGVTPKESHGAETPHYGYEINSVKVHSIGTTYGNTPDYYEGVYDSSKGMSMDIKGSLYIKDFNFPTDETVSLSIPLTVMTSLEY